MKKFITLAICMMAAITMLAGCSCSGCNGCNGCNGGKQESSTTVEPTAASTEETEETTADDHMFFEGTLIDGQEGIIYVLGDEKEMAFDISNTEFVNAENGLTFGDTLEVTYSEPKEGEYWASKVVVINEAEKIYYTFSGIVSDLHDELLDVTGEQSTVRFEVTEDTKVEGNLTKGDTVTVTYDSTISAYPIAQKIVVTSENEEPEKHVCIGWIGAIAGGEIYVSIESSHGFYFKIGNDTKITGKSTELKVGQKVSVSYNGDTDNAPTALTVEVLEDVKDEVYKISGTVSAVKEGSLSVKVGSNEYTFTTNKDTKYSGDKAAAGCSVTVKYTGVVEKNPVAVSVHCKSPEPESTTAAPTTTAETTTAAPTTSETTAAPTSETTAAPTTAETTTAPETTTVHPVIPPIDGSGIISEWSDNKCTIITDDNKKITLDIASDIEIAAGYSPAKGDVVYFKYEMMGMDLVELQLLGRPDTMCEGTVVSWNDGTCTLKNITIAQENVDTVTESGPVLGASSDDDDTSDEDIQSKDNVEFTLAANLDIDDDYIPEEGDIIRFKYEITEKNSSSGKNKTVYMITLVRFEASPLK